MTTPTPGEDPLSDLIGAGAQELIANANRLGLTWKLSLATVKSTAPLTAALDGDLAAIGVVSMIGSPFAPGSRVYVISVPPSGNFVVGQVEGGTPYRAQIITTETTASVTFSNIPADLRSLTIRAAARIVAGGVVALYLRINANASAANYYSHTYGSNGTGYVVPANNAASITALDVGLVAGATNPGEYASNEVVITGWNQPGVSFLTETFQANAFVGGTGFSRAGGGAYTGASPYTSITLLPSSSSFDAACEFDLIGDPA